MHDPVLGAIQQGQTLCPGRGHVGQGERVQERAVGAAAAVGVQVSLQNARFGIGPLGERAHRNLLLEQPPRLRRAHSGWLTQWRQQAIRGGRAEREQLLAHAVGQLQMAMPLERGDQLGQKRFQPLAADAVGRRAGARQRLSHFDSVGRAWPADGFRWFDRAKQQPDRLFAFVAGDGDELVEDGRALPMPGGPVPWCDLDQQLAFGAHR